MNAIIEVHSNFSEKVLKNSENCNVSCISFKSFPFSLCTVVSFKTHCLPSIGSNPIYLLLTYKKINFFSPLKHSFSLTLLHIKHLLRSNWIWSERVIVQLQVNKRMWGVKRKKKYTVDEDNETFFWVELSNLVFGQWDLVFKLVLCFGFYWSYRTLYIYIYIWST